MCLVNLFKGCYQGGYRMDDRQNNKGQRRNIGGGNNRPNNSYSKYGNNGYSNPNNSNNRGSANNPSRPINGGVRYTDNGGRTGYNNVQIGYGKNNPGYKGYDQNGSRYNKNSNVQGGKNNIGYEKYDDIKGLSEDYEEFNLEGDIVEDDNMDNPIDNKEKKKLIKKRIILGIKIFCIVMLLAVIIGGTVFYVKYGKEIAQMRADAKELVSKTSEQTFRRSAQNTYYGVRTGKSGKKEFVKLDMGLGSGQYAKSGGENMSLARDLMIYSEDRNFYKHHGVDFWANVKAVIIMILNGGEAKRGASTITQQLSRNVILKDFDQNWRRKVKEIFVSWELENKYTKEEIIEFYLNNINFSNGYMGIENAALGYFGEGIEKLNKSQVAYLCAIPNNPDMFDPYDLSHNEDTKKYPFNQYTWNRKNRLLGQLKKYSKGILDEADYTNACNEMFTLVDSNASKKNDADDDKYIVDRMLRTYILKCAKENIMEKVYNFKIKSPHEFVSSNKASAELEKKKYEEAYSQYSSMAETTLNEKEQNIYTSLDITMIEKLQDSIDKGIAQKSNSVVKATKKDDPKTYQVQGAGVTIDDFGFVVAMVNGRTGIDNPANWLGRAFGCNSSGSMNHNLARQPGSSIKPLIVYAPLFEEKYKQIKENGIENNDFSFLDEKVDDSGPYKVQGAAPITNHDRTYNHSKNIREAIQKSSNVVAYRLLENKDNFLNLPGWRTSKGIYYLKKLNFSFLTQKDTNNTRTSLGGFDYGATPLEMCAAYSYILMQMGSYRRPTCVMEITDKHYENVNEVNRNVITGPSVFSKDTMARIIDGLETVFQTGGTAQNYKLSNKKWEIAGKTGTTNNNVDGWFCGGTPKYTTAIWVGQDDSRTKSSSFSGPSVASIWKKYYDSLGTDKRIALELNTTSRFKKTYEFGQYLFGNKQQQQTQEDDPDASSDPFVSDDPFASMNAYETNYPFTSVEPSQTPSTETITPSPVVVPSVEPIETDDPFGYGSGDDDGDDDVNNNGDNNGGNNNGWPNNHGHGY